MTASCTRCHGAGSIVTHDADSDQWPRITCPRCWGEPMAQPAHDGDPRARITLDVPVTMRAEDQP